MFVVSQFVALLASLPLSFMPYPHRLVLPIAALAGILLLQVCSQALPDSFLAATPSPIPAKCTTGSAADSCNGTPGHAFSEPLSNFPGLVLLTEEKERGRRGYQLPAVARFPLSSYEFRPYW
jgi:hypothetical protein